MEWYWLQWISGAIGVQANQVYDFNFVSNKDEVYFIYHTIKNSAAPRGVAQLVWDPACMHEVPRLNHGEYRVGGGFLACIAPHSLAFFGC